MAEADFMSLWFEKDSRDDIGYFDTSNRLNIEYIHNDDKRIRIHVLAHNSQKLK